MLSHRPSVLAKLLPLLTGDHGSDFDHGSGFDLVGEGLEVSGPAWCDRLERMLAILSAGEREGLYAVRLEDELALPLPAAKVLAQARSAWFPEFLAHGRWVPQFQPIVDFATGGVLGREALMRGRLGAAELRGDDLVRAAEAHDGLYFFDRRARMVALEAGLPLLPPGEVLFVNLDPRAVVDIESSLSSTWPAVERVPQPRPSLCLELVAVDSTEDLGLLTALSAAHRERGASIALDDLSGGAASLARLEAVRPDFAKLDIALVGGIDRSPARRHLASAVIELAHELGTRVIAEGVERVAEYEAVRALGVDCGQGYFFGHPTERPLTVGVLEVDGLSADQ